MENLHKLFIKPLCTQCEELQGESNFTIVIILIPWLGIFIVL